MTELRVEKINIPAASFNGVSTLPAISENLRLSFMQDKFELSEEDGLFVNYGMVDYAFPYKAQDNYGRELKETETEVAVLENDYLRATFLPHRLGCGARRHRRRCRRRQNGRKRERFKSRHHPSIKRSPFFARLRSHPHAPHAGRPLRHDGGRL